MGTLFGGHKSTSSTTAQLSTLALSSSVYGAVIPIIYGATRIASNLIDYDDFTSVPHTTTTRTGKGGGGGSSSSTDYTYTAGIISALCQGPIAGIGTVWLDKDVTTLGAAGYTLLTGSRPQTPWATWTTKHPTKALGYSGIALVCNAAADLGSGATMPNFNFEVCGLMAAQVVWVPGSTRPWDAHAEGKNASHDFCDGGSTAPISIALGGKTGITLSATGNVGGVTMASGGTGPGGLIDYATQMYQPGNYSGTRCLLQGAFVDDAGTVIQAIAVGVGGSWTVPTGATHLQLGINDGANGYTYNPYSDNTGGFNVTTNIIGLDAAPSAVIPDFLSNSYYGAGWDATRLGDLTAYNTCCQANNYYISPAFTDQATAATCLQLILDATDAEAVWSAGSAGMTLKFVPYREWPVIGNGVTYTPVTSPIYDITDDDYLGVVNADGTTTGNDPIAVNRTSLLDVKNSIPIEYWLRSDSYNVHTAEEPDTADVSANGYKPASSMTLHLITNDAHAREISRVKGIRSVYVRNTYTMKLGWKFQLLEPMDLLTLTCAKAGLLHHIVRIVSVECPEETSEADGITVVAEDWIGVGTATTYPPSGGGGYTGSSSTSVTGVVTGTPGTTTITGTTSSATNTNADPGSVATPIIFEPPTSLSGDASPEIWIGAAGLGQYWGGCIVWVSVDGGASYSQAGTITTPARFGVTTALLPLVADPDNTSTLAVNLAASAGTLTGTGTAGLASWTTAALVDNEIVAYETATLTGTSAYNLTTLRRGGYGSAVASHAIGARFLRLDDALAKIPYSASLQGTTIYYKLQSYNSWGNALQDISTLTAYSYTPVGVAYPSSSSVTIAVTTAKPTVASGVACRLIDDWDDGISYNGGSPLALQKVWLDIRWAAAGTPPTEYEVVAFTGSDPTNPQTYLFSPIKVDGTCLRLVISVSPSAAAATVNAAVRSNYA